MCRFRSLCQGACIALGGLLLSVSLADARGPGGGGGHVGGGHAGGGHIGGAHIGGGHISGGHYGGAHISGGHYGGAHISGGHINGGHINGGHYAVPAYHSPAMGSHYHVTPGAAAYHHAAPATRPGSSVYHGMPGGRTFQPYPGGAHAHVGPGGTHAHPGYTNYYGNRGYGYNHNHYGYANGRPYYYRPYGYGGYYPYGYGGYGYGGGLLSLLGLGLLNGGYGYGYGGLGYGLLGGYGGYGGYGDYGGYGYGPTYINNYYVPDYNGAAPAVDSPSIIYPSAPQAADDNQAHLRIILPDATAQLWFDGTLTTNTGAQRDFDTPALKRGGEYFYHITAAWNQGGRIVTQERQVTIHAGDAWVIDFTQPAPPAPPAPPKQ